MGVVVKTVKLQGNDISSQAASQTLGESIGSMVSLRVLNLISCQLENEDDKTPSEAEERSYTKIERENVSDHQKETGG
ncbi:hypothetical protein LSAT2_031566 [Lamellibrachia satsuma]|nr:hypothetical protein LSAT2_031566 [Lamellibrachia satsuma]